LYNISVTLQVVNSNNKTVWKKTLTHAVRHSEEELQQE
jgi:hypothetical protein